MRIKPNALKGRVVSCAVPRLPGQVDAQGTVTVEVQVDEEGHVRCAGVLSGGSAIIEARSFRGR